METEVEDAVTEIHDPLMMRARARVGRVLREKWRLDVLLGVGGMAAVYAATHRNGSRAAVKLLHTELSINPAVRTRFLREGYAANSVGHEGAVKVIDDDAAEDGSLFLVTELLDGETLEDRRVRFGGKLSEDDVLSVADQLLDVLIAAHAKGVVHRDLKPENIFLTRTGQVKVLDFGIARLREVSTASSATRSGTSMGTPAYMPPEQARGLWDEVDARSDLWAVGATLFHLLSGKLIHEGRTANEQLLAAMTNSAPPLASVAPGTSPAVGLVVDRALTYERDKRWPDAARMQEVVRRAYHDRTGMPLTTAPRLTVPPTVPNRTLPSAEGAIAPRLPTTGQPVASSRDGLRLPASWPPWKAAAVLGGVLAVAVGAATIVTLAVVSHRASSASSAASLSASTLPPPAVSMTAAAASASDAPSSSALPEMAATDLPSATPQAPPTPPPAPTGRRNPPGRLPGPSPAPPPAQPAAPNCNPPWTVDAKTGFKIPKPGC
jgi:serine/threonine protein kinase